MSCGMWFRPLLCCLQFPVLAGLLLASPVHADWPQFLGPDRNGRAGGAPPVDWRMDPPQTVWRTDVGRGFSGPVTFGDRVILHHRRGNEEILEAWDRLSGKPLWKNSQPTAYEDDFGFDDGPRATPSVQGGTVYSFGAEGRLNAVRLSDGGLIWSLPLGRELKADKGFFGFACSPLVMSNRLVVQVGGAEGAGVVAVGLVDGKILWRATADEAGYASPVGVTIDGEERVVVFNRAGVRVLEGVGGRVLSAIPWRARMQASVNGATPVVGPDGVLVTTSYGVGANWLAWQGGGRLMSVWSNDESLSSHFVTPVRRGAHVYGFHGRQEQGAELRCVELKDGTVKWSSPRLGTGSLLLWGDRLLALLDSGELVVADASPDGWKELARHQVLGSGTRAIPALDRGVLYARDKTRLVALRIAPE